MIDTIVLKIKHLDFEVINTELFSPDLVMYSEDQIPRDLKYKPNKIHRKYTQNASSEDKTQGIYMPSLTLWRYYLNKKIEYYLYIQFSAPKLLSSNNLKELSSRDLFSVLDTLQSRLLQMGVQVTQQHLLTSEVIKVHFGKNIEVPSPFNVTSIISEIRKGDMGKSMEQNHRDYRNGGESLYFYNGSHTHIFYNKVKDMQKTKIHSADKDKTTYEKNIGYALEKSKRQVLRFEVRFTNTSLLKKTVNKTLKTKYEIIILETVFSDALWKKCLIDEWHSLLNRPANQLAFKTDISLEDTLSVFIERQIGKPNNNHTLNKVLISLCLYWIVSKIGVNALRNRLGGHWSSKTLGSRLEKKLQEISIELKDIPISKNISLIEIALQEFKYFELNP